MPPPHLSLNEKMHYRNPYKHNAPNFKALSVEYPELAKFLNGEERQIDFSDPEALSCLSRALLKTDFSLDVILPSERLIPCITQKLNYLLYVEDLLQCVGIDIGDELHGLDIGTGASCIHPLLFSRMHPKWKFTATEKDPESFKLAAENVKRNNLADQIKLVLCENELPIIPDDCSFDFLTCNPPFFASAGEAQALHKPDRVVKVNSTPCGTLSELVHPDRGEIGFVQKIFEASRSRRVRLSTTILGKKESLLHFLRAFPELDDGKATGFYFRHGQMCQGRTVRWVLAWGWDIPGLVTSSLSICSYRALGMPDFTKYWLNETDLVEVLERWTKPRSFSLKKEADYIELGFGKCGSVRLRMDELGVISWVGCVQTETLQDMKRFLINQSKPINAM